MNFLLISFQLTAGDIYANNIYFTGAFIISAPPIRNALHGTKKNKVHESSFSMVCEKRQQHLGHFVMFKLKNSVAQELVHNQIHEHTMTTEHLCAAAGKGSYYIHALYGVNPTIAALLNTKAYLYLFDNMDTIDNIVIFSSRKDGMRLAKAYGIKTVAKGKNSNCDFMWYGMESPVEDILFSDTVLRLVF